MNWKECTIYGGLLFEDKPLLLSAGHHNRSPIPGQGGGGERHAQHSGHIFQQ